MASGLPAEAASDVELLTSEVVSNAVKHANLSPSDEIIVRFVTGILDPAKVTRSALQNAASIAAIIPRGCFRLC